MTGWYTEMERVEMERDQLRDELQRTRDERHRLVQVLRELYDEAEEFRNTIGDALT